MARKPKTQPGSKRLFAWLMIASVAFLALPRRMTDPLDHFFASLFSPVTRFSRDGALAVERKLTLPETSTIPSEQYEQLKTAYQRLYLREQNLRQDYHQLRELAAQLASVEQSFGLARSQLIIANIIGADPSASRQIRLIDRGTLHRVQPGTIALAALGAEDLETTNVYEMAVIGRVMAAGTFSARLQLLTDPDFNIPAFIEPHPDRDRQQWRAHGIARGGVLADMTVSMISREYPIQPGDPVFACSDPATLPTAMLLGHVSSVRPNDQDPVLWTIHLTPAVTMDAIQQTIVVNPRGNLDRDMH